ncbi:hypothetical protein LSH36_79g11012 [Paralvinella palmiformis]|uniref:C2H2-type domain-containing protein n=1 Tax=Paralvinella palmiformis TaxID=53620 RepID=A0AAD9NDR7_9ANNE|nr:hypothetical protein LSH36_79g11012 [Paralvinella palmiformis]
MSKAYQERLIALIKDTVTLLCKNGLEYSQEFCVEGLLGVTLDKDEVFLIPIKELVNDKGVGTTDDDALYTSQTDVDISGEGMSPKRERKKKRRHAESSATHGDSKGNYDNGTGDWDSNVKDRSLDQEDINNTDDRPASKRLHEDSKTELSKVKAEDIVVIKEEVDDEEFVSAFQDSSMDSSSVNRTEQGDSGMAYYPQPGTSQGGGMGFSMDQLAEGAALSASMTGIPPGSEGDASTWLQQSPGSLQNPQGDWQGQKHQMVLSDELVCQICGQCFTQKGNLNRHYKSVHLQIRTKCDICGGSFSRSDQVKDHMRLKHPSAVF